MSYERLVNHLRFAIQHIESGETFYEMDGEMISLIKRSLDKRLCAQKKSGHL
ncbi:hypothetical protein PO124_16900 [Bacillus licheniformis]|nr:hypothetical protein [Bacillus licheniformis]